MVGREEVGQVLNVIAAGWAAGRIRTEGRGGVVRMRIASMRIDQVLGLQEAQVMAQTGLPAGPRIRAVAHPSLNAVILSGSEAQIRAAQSLINSLDNPAVVRAHGLEELAARIQQLEKRLEKLDEAIRTAK